MTDKKLLEMFNSLKDEDKIKILRKVIKDDNDFKSIKCQKDSLLLLKDYLLETIKPNKSIFYSQKEKRSYNIRNLYGLFYYNGLFKIASSDELNEKDHPPFHFLLLDFLSGEALGRDDKYFRKDTPSWKIKNEFVTLQKELCYLVPILSFIPMVLLQQEDTLTYLDLKTGNDIYHMTNLYLQNHPKFYLDITRVRR